MSRSQQPSRLPSPACLVVGLALIATACGRDNPQIAVPPELPPVDPTVEDPGGTPIEGDNATNFVSHVPGESDATRGGDHASGTGGSSATNEDAGAAPSAERAITEADILKVEGDTLYALSSYTGMTIIDLSTPSDLQVLGTYRSTATPFEMYLEGGTAYVMYNDYGYSEWDEDEGNYVWRSTSRLQAIDVSDPADPRVLGEQEMPGSISDSRKVGDIVYVVTHQSSYCWGCDAVANTRISSFDVSDPEVFNPVDEEVFETEDESWGSRSVSVTAERMYVSGRTWSSDGSTQDGTIQVVDISDSAGQIEPGAIVPIAGMIESRWQMDEVDGVLRVISQPGGWSNLDVPVVETFAVGSATEIVPLASLKMVLPRSENLQSVRFDGDRAFAVTFEQTDPLFTFDLSDPAAPRQVGELEIPGWLYHMEPRGDRLYALGFDPDVDNGALHVSIFDVSDLEAPTMLDRVNFGGDWGWFSEDQDRIHKLFNLALDQELILLPYSGSGYDEVSCTYFWGSGIQLIDVQGDDLTLRGSAPQVGTARRALLHNDILFGISDNAVQAFDISDRDQPKRLDRLDVARNVSQIKAVGDKLLRFGQNWWTAEVELDLVDFADAEKAESAALLDLTGLTDIHERYCSDGSDYSSTYFNGQVFVHGEYAFVPRTTYHYGQRDGTYFSEEVLLIEVIDLSDPSDPTIVGELELEPTGWDEAREKSTYYLGFVQTDSTLLVGRTMGDYSYDPDTGEYQEPDYAYDVIDLRAGADAEVVARVEVPRSLSRGGWGYGVTGCTLDMGWGFWGYYGYGYGNSLALTSGDVVASQHEVEIDDGSGRVRYYLDRIDLSDPSNPVFLDQVNIPGQLVRYDHARGRLVTMDYDPEVFPQARSWEACDALNVGAVFEYDQDALEASDYDWNNVPGTCVRWHRRLHSLVLDGTSARRLSFIDLERDGADGKARSVPQVAVTDDRVFYQRWSHGEDSWTLVDPEFVALGYAQDGRLSHIASMMRENGSPYGSLVGRGKRAFISGNGVLEVISSNKDQSLSSSEHPLRSWSCGEGSLEVVGDQAFCAMGMYGVQSIPLE